MPISTPEFVEQLTESCPQTLPIVTEHLVYFENEVLLHLLMADVRRFAIERFEAGDDEVLNLILGVVARGLTDGDEYVENAAGVSFVEDTGWWDPTMEPFIATWPLPLRQEAERQANWRQGNT